MDRSSFTSSGRWVQMAPNRPESWHKTNGSPDMLAIQAQKSSVQGFGVTKPGMYHVDPMEQRLSMPIDKILQILRDKLYQKVEGGPMSLRQYFRVFDRDGSGKITANEFRDAVHDFGLPLKEEELRAFMLKFDPNGDGSIDYYEFIQKLLPPDYVGHWDSRPPVKVEGHGVFKEGKMHLDPTALRAPMTTEAIEKIIREKLYQRVEGGPMSLRQLFRVFDRDGSGTITYDEFKKAVLDFALPLKDEEVERIMKLYDPSGNGEIDYYEFINRLLPPDYTSDWDPNAASRKPQHHEAAGFGMAKPGLYHLDPEDFTATMSVEQIEQVMRDKLEQKTRGGPMSLRQMFRKFDVDGSGKVSFSELRSTLHDFGLPLKDSELMALMKRYDPNGDGELDYYEFVKRLLPPDYTGSWNEKLLQSNDNMMKCKPSAVVSTHTTYRTMGSIHHDTTNRPAFTTEQIEDIIRQKLQAKTRGGPMALRAAFKHFDRDGSGKITPEEFCKVCFDFGLPLKPVELDAFMTKYDPSGDQEIDYLEFVNQIVPPDYTRLWSSTYK